MEAFFYFHFLRFNLSYFLNCVMTNTNLERAQQIKEEIADLKGSLAQISRGKIFDIQETFGCVTRRGSADPFLAQVENEIKTYANTKILQQITNLEKEFASL